MTNILTMLKMGLSTTIYILIASQSAIFVDAKRYDFFPERAELLFTNDSYIKNVHFHFGRVNRTFSALNASFDIVREFNEKMFGTLKAYQFFHNEYRFTGTKMTADTCKIERANIFSLKEQFRDAQFEIDFCQIEKGHYKLVNFAPQAKYYPLYLPMGKIRSNVRLHDGRGTDFFSLNWDFEIKEAHTA